MFVPFVSRRSANFIPKKKNKKLNDLNLLLVSIVLRTTSKKRKKNTIIKNIKKQDF